jgi:hypothetical protein
MHAATKQEMQRSKKMKILIVLIALLWAGWAEAQSTLSVNINQARLEWNWAKGVAPDDGLPDEFLIRCGQGGTVTKTTSANPIARSLPIKQVITGSGDWHCTVTAANTFGESGASNQVFFAAGALPSAPTSVKVVAQ